MFKICRYTFSKAYLEIDVIYAFYPESFCDKNLAIQKVFAFSDSDFRDASASKNIGIALLRKKDHHIPSPQKYDHRSSLCGNNKLPQSFL